MAETHAATIAPPLSVPTSFQRPEEFLGQIDNQVEDDAISPTIVASRVLPVVSAAIAIGVFILDLVTPADSAVAVLYVGAVLLSARFLQKRGLVLASLGCMALTVLAHFLSPLEVSQSIALSNRFFCLAAIGVTAFLAVQSQSRETAVKRADQELRQAQAELARVTRVTTLGQLTASIAHEVIQPIGAMVTNAQTGLRWLGAAPPNLEEARHSFDRIVKDGSRAGDVIGRIRSLVKKAPPLKARFDLNEAVLDVIALTRSEVLKHGVSLETQLGEGLPLLRADRVQLQQVILNLILNAVEAMSSLDGGPRKLGISTEREASGGVRVTVLDSGPGLDPQSADRLFEAFYTTKPEGMGMGLAICRSIIGGHGGRLWATANEPRGAVFQFTLPPDRDETAPAEHAGHMPVV